VRAGKPLILGYHGVGGVGLEHDPIALYVSPEALAAQVRKLQRRGYEFVTMSEFGDRLRAAGGPPPGVAALTFDDGTVDHATILPGVLESLGVPGTVYVCPGLAGQPYPWTSAEAGVRFMTESELIAVAEHPLIEIGAHTNDHHELHEADRGTALEELGRCKETLEGLLGTEVVSFCYPRCHYSQAAREAAETIGYKTAVTCGMRGSWEPFELKREVMHSGDGPAVVAMRLRGIYTGLGSSLPARGVRHAARVIDRVSGGGARGAGAAVPCTVDLLPT